MASSLHQFILFSLLLFSFSLSLSITTKAQASFKPKALVLPVSKDASTHQYITHFKQRTPFVSLKLVLDLGGPYLWVDCDNGYKSSSYISPQCGSPDCALVGTYGCSTCNSPAKPGCGKNTCSVSPYNPVQRLSTSGDIAQDVVSLQSTNGRNPGPYVIVPRFIFGCGSTNLLGALAKGANGMVGLGRSRIGLPLQFSATFGFRMKFAICLTSSATSTGVVVFGDGPYVMLPGIDVSTDLIYTPLFVNPVSTAGSYFKGDKSTDYFIGVTSIKINDMAVPLNATLLKISRKRGLGGTKISTVHPYTVMETSIYKSFTDAFFKASASMKLTRVAAVAPFKICFSSKNIGSTRVGPPVPTIDLVLQSKDVFWRIFGANSMVHVSNDVMCLGFVDGGLEPRTSIVIGAYQLENNLLQFDLRNSRLGFSSSLLFRQTTCANFNFTSNA